MFAELLILELFQVLFGTIVIVDWNTLDHGRALAGYFAGCCVLWLGNVFRIALLVVVGNRVSADFVVSKHLPASWFVIALTLVAYVVLVYPWMLKEEQATSYTTQLQGKQLSVVQ